MDFIDQIQALVARISKQLVHIETEEGTKTALVLPFINALGYNVFDPTEVRPEFICDVGIKKGEKIDYAIMKDGVVAMLIECKPVNCDLCFAHASQLYRYFAVTSARIGVLTNGVHYQFFTDLDEPNKMDQKPFLEFNITNIPEGLVPEIKKLTKPHLVWLLGTPGPNTLTITSGTATLGIAATALAVVTRITLSPDSLPVQMGNTYQVTAAAIGVDGAVVPTDGRLAWTSSDTSIATVSSAGLVTGRWPGRATISASIGTVRADRLARVDLWGTWALDSVNGGRPPITRIDPYSSCTRTDGTFTYQGGSLSFDRTIAEWRVETSFTCGSTRGQASDLGWSRYTVTGSTIDFDHPGYITSKLAGSFDGCRIRITGADKAVVRAGYRMVFRKVSIYPTPCP